MRDKRTVPLSLVFMAMFSAENPSFLTGQKRYRTAEFARPNGRMISIPLERQEAVQNRDAS